MDYGAGNFEAEDVFRKYLYMQSVLRKVAIKKELEEHSILAQGELIRQWEGSLDRGEVEEALCFAVTGAT